MDRESRWQIYKLQSDICKALSDPTRLVILDELYNGEKSVGELVSSLGLRQANVSQHLTLLRERGLVTYRREGTTIYYSLTIPKIMEACDIIHQVLAERLEQGRILAEEARSWIPEQQ